MITCASATTRPRSKSFITSIDGRPFAWAENEVNVMSINTMFMPTIKAMWMPNRGVE